MASDYIQKEIDRNKKLGGTTVGDAYASGQRGTGAVGSYTSTTQPQTASQSDAASQGNTTPSMQDFRSMTPLERSQTYAGKEGAGRVGVDQQILGEGNIIGAENPKPVTSGEINQSMNRSSSMQDIVNKVRDSGVKPVNAVINYGEALTQQSRAGDKQEGLLGYDANRKPVYADGYSNGQQLQDTPTPTQQMPQQGDPFGISQMMGSSTGYEHLDRQMQIGGMMYAQSVQSEKENSMFSNELLRRQYERELMKTDAIDDIRPGMSIEDYQDLRSYEMRDLSDEEKARIQRGGEIQKRAIDLETGVRLAEEDASQRQVERIMGRKLDDREQFNMQQDTKRKRLLASFGGGEVQSMAGNAEILHADNLAQRALEDIQTEYADRVDQFSVRRDAIIRDAGIRKQAIDHETQTTIEDAWVDLNNKLDQLEIGKYTTEAEARKAMLGHMQNYLSVYNDTMNAAYELKQQEAAAIEAEKVRLREEAQKWDEEMTKNTGYVYQNGQRYIDPNTGMPVQTLDYMEEARLQQRLGLDQSKYGLDYAKFQQGNMQWATEFGQKNQQWAAEMAFKQAQEGISLTSGDVNPSWSGNIEKSSYQPIVNQDGSITVPIMTGATGSQLPDYRWDGRKLNKSSYQCGEFVNDFLGSGVMQDTYDSKMAKVTTMTPQPGSAFVMNGGKYGHTGIVERVNEDGSIDIVDANAFGSGQIRRTTLQLDPNTGKYKDGSRYIQGFTGGIAPAGGGQGAFSFGGFSATKTDGTGAQGATAMSGAGLEDISNIRTIDGKAMNETQAKSYAFAKRMMQAEQDFNSVAKEIESAAMAARPGLEMNPLTGFGIPGSLAKMVPGAGQFSTGRMLPNELKGAGIQKQEQAERAFLNAVLRKESGAAISDSEWAEGRARYFPQPGDTKEVIDQKRKNRELDMQTMAQSSNVPAQYFQDVMGGQGFNTGNLMNQVRSTLTPSLMNAEAKQYGADNFLNSLGY